MHVRLLSINEAFLACKPSTIGGQTLWVHIWFFEPFTNFTDIFDSFAYPKFEKNYKFLGDYFRIYMRLQIVIGPIVPICLPSISFFVLRPKFSSQNYYAIIRWISFWRSIFNFHATTLSQDIIETFIYECYVWYTV